jgi:hypothetical protein
MLVLGLKGNEHTKQTGKEKERTTHSRLLLILTGTILSSIADKPFDMSTHFSRSSCIASIDSALRRNPGSHEPSDAIATTTPAIPADRGAWPDTP